MSHWAELDENNLVIRILVGDNDDPNGDEGYRWLTENLGGTWIQTSYNGNFGGKFASIGDEWNGTDFISPITENHNYVFDEQYELPGGEDYSGPNEYEQIPNQIVLSKEDELIILPLLEALEKATNNDERSLRQDALDEATSLIIKNYEIPQPFPSWSKNEEGFWESPIEKPAGNYFWDEERLCWIETTV